MTDKRTIISILLIIISITIPFVFNNTIAYYISLIIISISGAILYKVYQKEAYTNSYKIFFFIYIIIFISTTLKEGIRLAAGLFYASFLYSIMLFTLIIIGMLIANLIHLFKKKKKSLKKKIIIILLLVLLLSPLVFFTNAFFGNPISQTLSMIYSDKYIKQNYSNLAVKRDESFYNFKNSEYIIKYNSDKLMDLNFEVHCDALGRIKYDTYKEDIIDKGSTLTRLEKELREESQIKELQNRSIQYSFFFNVEDKYKIKNKLKSEMSLAEAKSIFDVEINITYITNKVDIQQLQNDLKEIYENHNKNYNIKTIYLDIEEGPDTIIFMDELNPKNIYGKNGLKRLQEKYDNNDKKIAK